MVTLYDWLSLILFCGLATLFLSRSIGPRVAGDRAIYYVPAALGCAVANKLGNDGADVAATTLLIATLGYLLLALKPWRRPP